MKNDFVEMNLDDIEKSDVATNRPLKLDDGDTILRILPPWRAGALYLKKYRMHFGLADLREFGLKTDGWFAEPCLAERSIVDDTTQREVTGQPCPLCEVANKAWVVGNRSKDEEVLGIAKKIRAKTQYVSNVIDMSNVTEGVQRYVYGKKINDSLKGFFRKKKNITNPHDGRAICVTKKQIPGQFWPEYSVMLEDSEDLGELWDSVKDTMFNLDEYPIYADYDELEKRVEGVSFSLQVGGNSRLSVDSSDSDLDDEDSASLDSLLAG